MSYGFINTRFERLKPIIDRLLKASNKDFSSSTHISVELAANEFLDIIDNSFVRINASYIIYKDQFIRVDDYSNLDAKIGTLNCITTPLTWWKRVKLAYDVFKKVK